jgi:hypothetical protein
MLTFVGSTPDLHEAADKTQEDELVGTFEMFFQHLVSLPFLHAFSTAFMLVVWYCRLGWPLSARLSSRLRLREPPVLRGCFNRLKNDEQARVNSSVLGLLPDFILVLFLKCVQQAQCRSERELHLEWSTATYGHLVEAVFNRVVQL